MWMHGPGDGWGWTPMAGMGLIWILLLVVLVFVVWRLAGANGRGPGEPPAAKESPLEILERRYARGEIDREEFEQRRRDLRA